MILVAAKPFGLLGERLAAIPSVHLKLKDGFLQFVLPEVPKVKVNPVMNVDCGTASHIPRAARWFLQ